MTLCPMNFIVGLRYQLAHWVGFPVVGDAGLITSRNSDDLDASTIGGLVT